MNKLEEFTNELTTLCNKYGYVITGKTTSNIVHVCKCDNVYCEIKAKFDEGAFILCKGKE